MSHPHRQTVCTKGDGLVLARLLKLYDNQETPAGAHMKMMMMMMQDPHSVYRGPGFVADANGTGSLGNGSRHKDKAPNP